LSAQRWLRDGERLGGFAKMQLPRNLSEINKVAKLERELILTRHHRQRNKYFQAWQLYVRVMGAR